MKNEMSDEYCAVRFADGKYLVCNYGQRGIEWDKGDGANAYIQSRAFLEKNFHCDEKFEIVNI